MLRANRHSYSASLDHSGPAVLRWGTLSGEGRVYGGTVFTQGQDGDSNAGIPVGLGSLAGRHGGEKLGHRTRDTYPSRSSPLPGPEHKEDDDGHEESP
jgi:hypothetical protein